MREIQRQTDKQQVASQIALHGGQLVPDKDIMST